MNDQRLNHCDLANRIKSMVADVVASYEQCEHTQHLNSTFLPNRDRVVEIVELLRRIIFPGFFDEQRLTTANVQYHVGELLTKTSDLLYQQIRAALRYGKNVTDGPGSGDACSHCDEQARKITIDFLETIPELRRKLSLDVQAAFEGDPAAVNMDENIFCYPGIDAIFCHRIAHELWLMEVPLLPRIMSEYAHTESGIDIHPGATIGESFFIDHGTGVVVGETTTIGKNVKLYQGVTLGALSTKGGQAWRGRKRHPTIEDDVTIYPNATILGGETVIGRGCTVNGSVFLTQSVPPGHTVRVKHPEIELRENRNLKRIAKRDAEK